MLGRSLTGSVPQFTFTTQADRPKFSSLKANHPLKHISITSSSALLRFYSRNTFLKLLGLIIGPRNCRQREKSLMVLTNRGECKFDVTAWKKKEGRRFGSQVPHVHAKLSDSKVRYQTPSKAPEKVTLMRWFGEVLRLRRKILAKPKISRHVPSKDADS